MECKRCGHCCMAVGSTFWTHGDFKQWPKLQELKDTVELGGYDSMPCQMLIVRKGKAYCDIELKYGRRAKPDVCKEYPELECHQQTKTFTGRGVCEQV